MPVQIIGGVRRGGAPSADLQAAITATLTDWGAATTGQIRDAWSGWKRPTGRSQAAWGLRGPDQRAGVVAVEIVNVVPYVPFVHHAGQGIPALDQIERDLLPDAEARLVSGLAEVGASIPLTAA